MKDQSGVELEAPSSRVGFEEKRSVFLHPGRLRHLFHSLLQWLIKDWQSNKYFFFGILLLLATIIMTVIYYVDYPRPELIADTPAYLVVAYKLYVHPYLLVDTWRLPGYPLLIAMVYYIHGQGNFDGRE